MILIKIPIKLTLPQLEAAVTTMRYWLMSRDDIMVNGKSQISKERTLAYQTALKLTEKLAKSLVDKQLNPLKKKEFKLKLNYPEAYTLYNVLFEVETPEHISLYVRSVFNQLDKLL